MTAYHAAPGGEFGHRPPMGTAHPRPTRRWRPRPRVCVIGAGVAGLVSAKVLRDDGFRVTVFEREPEPGGVWSSSRSYPGLRANTPREVYSFSDFPYPDGTDDFPTAAQVRGYLEAYADHFGLGPLLELSTEVRSVVRSGAWRGGAAEETEGEEEAAAEGAEAAEDEEAADGLGDGADPFEVTVSPVGVGELHRRTFDFVVVCSGTFSTPLVPEFPGRDRFQGEVGHSSRFPKEVELEEERVVVVGGGKSALGLAASLAERARAVTLVCRRPHWMVPRYLPGGVRMDRAFVTRFAEDLLPPYHSVPSRGERTPRQSLLRRMASPLLRLWWAAQTRMVPLLAGMPPTLVPESPLPGGLEKSGVGTEFYRALADGRAEVERSGIAAFSGPDTLRVASGREIEADRVVLATGWRMGFPFLDDELAGEVERGGRIHLYRRILPPGEPRMGFIGFASSSACTLTSELAAHWLSQSFRGELELPGPGAMEREVQSFHEWSSRTFPDRPEGAFIGPYIAHYLDELMREMGLSPRRRANPLREYFGVLTADRYRAVGEERRVGRREARVRGA